MRVNVRVGPPVVDNTVINVLRTCAFCSGITAFLPPFPVSLADSSCLLFPFHWPAVLDTRFTVGQYSRLLAS